MLRRARPYCALLAIFATVGCAIVDSERIDQANDGCVTSLGHYYLPKRYLRVEVTQAEGSPPDILLTRGESYGHLD